MRVAQIDPASQNVVNVIMLDDISEMPAGFTAVQSDTANIGDTWDGTKFTSPVIPAAVPQEVTLAQARAALMAAGLFTKVDSYVKGSGNALAQMAWEYTNMVDRKGALVVALAPALGLTDAQLDQLFTAAAGIKL